MKIIILGIQGISPKLSKLASSARVAPLLKARSDIYHLASRMTKSRKKNLSEHNSSKHGTYYYSTNWDFNTLGGILGKQIGKSLYELFLKEIAKPVGLKNH